MTEETGWPPAEPDEAQAEPTAADASLADAEPADAPVAQEDTEPAEDVTDAPSAPVDPQWQPNIGGP